MRLRLLALLSGLLALPLPGSASTIAWTDDFDDGNLDGWDVRVENGSLAVEDGRVHMASFDGDGAAEARTTLPAFDRGSPFGLFADFLLPHDNNHWFYVLGGPGGALIVDFGDQLRWWTGSTYRVVTIPTGAWVRLGVCIDPAGDRAAVFVDGVPVANDLPLADTSGSELRIGEPVDGGRNWGEAYWDNLALVVACEMPPPPPPPANDDRANATVIDALPFETGVDGTRATFEAGETLPCGSTDGGSTWFTLVAPRAMELRVDAELDWGGVAAIYGAAGPLACEDSGAPSPVAPVAAGERVWIQVAFATGEEPWGDVRVRETARPPNDLRADAEAIGALPFDAVRSSLDATTEAEEPLPCGDIGATVWFRHVATEDTVLRADLEAFRFFPILAVYEEGALVRCEEHRYGEPVHVAFRVTAGTTYWLQVGGAYGGEGSFRLRLAVAERPAHDDRARALRVDGDFEDRVDARNLTREPDDPCSLDGTVWYAFTPTEDADARLTVSQGGYYVDAAVFAGHGKGYPSYLGCASSDDDRFEATVEFRALAGTTYHLLAGGYPDTREPLVVRLSTEAREEPAVTVSVVEDEGGAPAARVVVHPSQADEGELVFVEAFAYQTGALP